MSDDRTTRFAVVAGDTVAARAPGWRLPVVIILDRLRSAFNVGNIFRLAEATGVEKIVTCGYTATPPHEKLQKTARGCDALVPCEHADTAAAAVAACKAAGYTVYAVETVAGAAPVWTAELRFPLAFVLGNEALGVAPDTLALCDAAVALPCFGTKNSVNVGNCAAVVLYAAVARWQAQGGTGCS